MNGYLHGYSDDERARLEAQAGVLAPWVHRDLPFTASRRLIEIGCGTGAQLELLLQAFPALRVTGVDHAAIQLETARANLASHRPRTALVLAEAERLPFDSGEFDAAFLCWILEHVASPPAVLRELHRVLAPGAPVVVTEVVNTTLHLHPAAPATMAYWDAFNRHQRDLGGDPDAGATVGQHLHAAGFREIRTELREVILDDRDPASRAGVCRACTDLLLSAAPGLLERGLVDQAGIDAMRTELAALGRGPGTVFFYGFVQARCVR
jgi:SAM-dependent methyltransferase